jgi:hypothetical protein
MCDHILSIGFNSGLYVVEKLVEYYLVFLGYYFDGTFHYPIG